MHLDSLLTPLMLLIVIGTITFLIRRIRLQILLQNHRLETMLQYVTVDMPAKLVAAILIEDAGLEGDVRVKSSDQVEFNAYDSDASTVLLTGETGSSTGVYSHFVAAHEVGHAVIDHCSRLLKLIIDSAAIFMQLRFMKMEIGSWIAAVGVIALWADCFELFLGSTILSGLLLIATLIIQCMEHLATRIGSRLLQTRLPVSGEIQSHLQRCGRAAGLTHLCDVAYPACFLLVLVAGYGWLPQWAILAPLLGCALLLLALFCYRRTIGTKLQANCRLPLPFCPEPAGPFVHSNRRKQNIC